MVGEVTIRTALFCASEPLHLKISRAVGVRPDGQKAGDPDALKTSTA